MTSNRPKHIAVVLGMHRSGTSALTKSLEILGVDLGTELHQARYDNPKGFWEDKDCVHINDALLTHMGSNWRDPQIITGLIADQTEQELFDKAAALISQRIQTHRFWGFKDPRTCRLIPFWKSVFKKVGAEPLFIIALRNPLSVAASLLKRDNIETSLSAYLWAQHIIPAIKETTGHKRIVVDYDRLISAPREEIKRMGASLGLNISAKQNQKIEEYCSEFIEANLRHASFTLAQLKANSQIDKTISDLYGSLLKVADGSLDLEAPEVTQSIDSCSEHLALLTPAFSIISSIEKDRAQKLENLQSSLQLVEDRARAMASLQERFNENINHGEQLKGELSRIKNIITEKDELIGKLENSLKENSFANASLKNVVTELTQFNAKLERALSEARQKFDQLSREKEHWLKLSSQYQDERTLAQERLGVEIRQVHLLKVELTKLTEEIKEIAPLKAEVVSLSTKLAESLEEQNKTRIAIDSLKQLNASVTSDLNSSLGQIKSNEEQLASLEATNKSLLTDLANLNEDLISLKDRHDSAVDLLENQKQSTIAQEIQLANLSSENAALTQAKTELQNQLNILHQIATEKQATINQMVQSRSWQMTKPLRATTHIAKKSIEATKRIPRRLALSTWHRLPINRNKKDKIRDFAFTRMPILFRNTNRYLSWKSARQITHDLSANSNLTKYQGVDESVEFSQYNDSFDTKLIAFYLPQFHPIAENNTWWGEGFTEWTNVKPAEPQFEGHYQPRIPGELGYYNLLDGKTQKRQVELAKNYGIGGFCFYMYWFGGKRLLEQPLDNYLRDQSLDLPFCVCWANENWSRRWDGLDQEILMSQDHSPEDDIAFITEAAKYLRDPRYIRVENKPLLLIYRPALFPDIKATAIRWRHWCQENGIGEIHLAYTQSFESVDPKEYGFDSAIEFPPNNACPPNLTSSVQPLNENFSGTVYDWRHYPARSENYPDVNYTLFRAVCPAWDNTARRKNKGTVFLNSSPAAYQRWLENALNDTARRFDESSKKLVFINAWNEWAEGAYLEPDQKHGYAFLEATRNALINSSTPKIGSILLTTHDCHKHGAQIQTLETARTLAEMGYAVSVIALQGGELLPAFKKIARIIDASQSTTGEIDSFLRETQRMGTTVAITSTVVSGSILPKLKEAGFAIISLIHELPGIIHSLGQLNNAELIAQHADKVVFPAKLVRDKFCELVTINESKIILRPQGLLRRNPFKSQKKELRSELLKQKNLPDNAKVVLTVGYGDTRKGADLIADLADETIKLEPNCYFIWVGKIDPTILSQVKERAQKKGILNHLIFTGFEADPARFYAVADAYALTSREDPFPNVVNEAIDMDIPVVGFEGASGASDFILANKGRLAKFLDLKDFAVNLQSILNQNQEALPHKPHSLRQYILDLLFHLTGQPRISVVIPNYNYAHFLEARINSICKQTFPVYEMIILDDKSTDNSIEIIETISQKISLDTTIVRNEINSGSVFKQWHRGAKIAQGDLLWIAEADDLADPDFLSTLVTRFKDPELVLAYTESKQMDHRGNVISPNYLDYTLRASECFKNDYHRHGTQEIIKALAIKNTIPNVSAVVFKTNSLVQVMEQLEKELANMKVAGDWLVYLHLLKNGNVSFSTKALNCHRRHATSVTSALQKQIHLQEIIKMQTLASRVVTLPHTTLDKCTEYIKEIENYFGITAEALDRSVNS